MGNNTRRDIEALRLLSMLCIVMGHCFAIYGVWQTPLVSSISSEAYLYRAVNPLLTYYALPVFTAISGYLIGYRNVFESSSFSYTLFIWKKIKRLYFPAISFSLIYAALFHKETFSDPIFFLRLLVDGQGHLWFLYMLFSLYALSYGIYRASQWVPNWIFVSASLSISIVACFFDLKTSISTSFFYQFFFIFGILFGKKHRQEREQKVKHLFPKIISRLMLYIIIFCLLAIIKESEETTAIVAYCQRLQYFQHWFFRLLVGSLSVSLTFSLLPLSIQRNRVLSVSSSICYKLYIVHQFILVGLLDGFPSFLNILYQHIPWIFPFCLFILVFSVSLFVSLVFRKIPILKDL